jgi:hypothetical protein
MSADNGIYILPDKDGYRVAYGSAIDNLTFMADSNGDGEYNYQALVTYFGKSKVCATEEEAWKEAQKKYDNFFATGGLVLEYGISKLPRFEGSIKELMESGIKSQWETGKW